MEGVLCGAGGALVVMIALWVRSLATRDVTIIDVFWGPGFMLQAGIAAGVHGELSNRGILLLALVGVWSVRLGFHLWRRSAGRPEDSRYARMRADRPEGFGLWSLVWIFGLQAALMTAVALPLTLGLGAGQAAPWGLLDGVGVGLWGLGFFFEVVGDHQLSAFRRDPTSAGRVLEDGLWRYTRHPNYFGECCLWWGLFAIAFAGGAPGWTLGSPILMTWLLLRVSGVALLEETIGDRRPGYAEYKARTSAFLPWFPGARP